jgi:mono/diheme cytochrome c family protein
VFVLDSSRAVRYQGRIDDRYASRARQRSQITTHDLEVALEAVLTGKPVQVASTAAFGCAIVRPLTASPSGDARVTYYRDVAPILHERCQSCHRPGQIAPFSLASYADARNWATEIKTFTGNRQMPPWKAEPGHGEFSDVRRLSDQEVETLAAWADAGAPAGNIKDAPAPKQWPSNWALGEPDLVLKMPEAYQVSAGGKDDFRCFVLPTNLPEDKQVVAVEVRPGNPRVVHHVLNFLDIRGAARKLDERDPLPGYNSGLGGIGIQPSGALGGWAPGNLPRFLPEGVGLPLPKGADVVLQVHYHKTGKPETDQTMIGIHFAKKPIEKRLRTWPLTTLAINIPPGEARHEVRSQMMLPFDVHALGITPHMHLLGREMKVTATLPDGTEKSLVWIKDWDYRWQDTYRYQEPVALPRGTRLNLVAYYDNSTGNPLNPSSPPQRVTFGEETTDEMCFAFIGFTMDREPPGGGRLGGAFGLF